MDADARLAWCAVASACRGDIEKDLRTLAEEVEDFDPDEVLPPFRIDRCGGADHFTVRIEPIIKPRTPMESEALTAGCDPAKEFVALFDVKFGERVARLPFASPKVDILSSVKY